MLYLTCPRFACSVAHQVRVVMELSQRARSCTSLSLALASKKRSAAQSPQKLGWKLPILKDIPWSQYTNQFDSPRVALANTITDENIAEVIRKRFRYLRYLFLGDSI